MGIACSSNTSGDEVEGFKTCELEPDYNAQEHTYEFVDPFPSALHGYVSPTEYHDDMETLNAALEAARTDGKDVGAALTAVRRVVAELLHPKYSKRGIQVDVIEEPPTWLRPPSLYLRILLPLDRKGGGETVHNNPLLRLRSPSLTNAMHFIATNAYGGARFASSGSFRRRLSASSSVSSDDIPVPRLPPRVVHSGDSDSDSDLSEQVDLREISTSAKTFSLGINSPWVGGIGAGGGSVNTFYIGGGSGPPTTGSLGRSGVQQLTRSPFMFGQSPGPPHRPPLPFGPPRGSPYITGLSLPGPMPGGGDSTQQQQQQSQQQPLLLQIQRTALGHARNRPISATLSPLVIANGGGTPVQRSISAPVPAAAATSAAYGSSPYASSPRIGGLQPQQFQQPRGSPALIATNDPLLLRRQLVMGAAAGGPLTASPALGGLSVGRNARARSGSSSSSSGGGVGGLPRLRVQQLQLGSPFIDGDLTDELDGPASMSPMALPPVANGHSAVAAAAAGDRRSVGTSNSSVSGGGAQPIYALDRARWRASRERIARQQRGMSDSAGFSPGLSGVNAAASGASSGLLGPSSSYLPSPLSPLYLSSSGNAATSAGFASPSQTSGNIIGGNAIAPISLGPAIGHATGIQQQQQQQQQQPHGSIGRNSGALSAIISHSNNAAATRPFVFTFQLPDGQSLPSIAEVHEPPSTTRSAEPPTLSQFSSASSIFGGSSGTAILGGHATGVSPKNSHSTSGASARSGDFSGISIPLGASVHVRSTGGLPSLLSVIAEHPHDHDGEGEGEGDRGSVASGT